MNFSTGNIILDSLLLALGLFMLLKGSDMFVDASAFIARHFNVSEIIIGLTLVSIGTSLPELATNIYASFSGEAEIALGNVVGSNITNISLILGVAALIGKGLPVPKSMIQRDIPAMIFVFIFFFFLCYTGPGGDKPDHFLSRLDGLLLLAFFIIYLISLFKNKSAGETTENKEEKHDGHKVQSVLKAVIFFILGLIMITAGSKLAVDNVVYIATKLHIPKELISATIIAFGTSIPELAVTVTGIIKKQGGLALGNIIGSCIFNIVLVMSSAVIISPLSVSSQMLSFILPLMLLCGISLSIFMKTENKLIKSEGFILLLLYVVFIIYNIKQVV